MRAHIGIDGHYSFHLPDLGGVHRPLRDPDTTDDEYMRERLRVAGITGDRPRLGLRWQGTYGESSAARP